MRHGLGCGGLGAVKRERPGSHGHSRTLPMPYGEAWPGLVERGLLWLQRQRRKMPCARWFGGWRRREIAGVGVRDRGEFDRTVAAHYLPDAWGLGVCRWTSKAAGGCVLGGAVPEADGRVSQCART